MVLAAEKTRRLISGLTVASFFLGLFLGYNNISIFSSETVQEDTPSPTPEPGSELQNFEGKISKGEHSRCRTRFVKPFGFCLL